MSMQPEAEIADVELLDGRFRRQIRTAEIRIDLAADLGEQIAKIGPWLVLDPQLTVGYAALNEIDASRSARFALDGRSRTMSCVAAARIER